MFESTLEAQGLGEGHRRIGALSVAVLAHLGIGLAIVAATALIVPTITPPEVPVRPFAIVSLPPLDLPRDHPTAVPAPIKGTHVPKPGSHVLPPTVAPRVPPIETPESLRGTEHDSVPDGPDTPGDGREGDPDGSLHGVPGGTGDVDSGLGVEPAAGPLELTGDMKRPILLVKVEPSYPQVARRAGMGGRVTLRAVIAEDGSVESVEVLASTNLLFNDAAVEAVRKWRYRPALMNGRPVRVTFSVVVDFLVR
jgi:protein TonB